MLSLVSFLFALPALACSPARGPELTLEQKVNNAGFVLLVRAEPGSTRKDPARGESVGLHVLHRWKGDPGPKPRYQNSAYGTCGFPLQEGGIYLLFAGQLPDGALASTAFTGTADLLSAPVALRELAAKELKRKLPAPEAKECVNEFDPPKRAQCYAEALARLRKAWGVDWN